jgi:subtilisin family serine protease
MRIAFRVACCVIVLAVLASVVIDRIGHTNPLDPKAAAANKIAPWLRGHLARGTQTEYLVVMNDQADLSGADALATKAEKGQFVYNALFQKAQQTQAPVIDMLKAQKVEYRSYYIVNMIWVKGDLDLAESLAGRSDIARIEGNPTVQNRLPQPEPVDFTARPEAPEAIEPGVNHTRAPEVWASGFTGQGVVVGAEDTGYRWDHAALKDHYRGWNGTTADHNFNWHDSVHTGGGTCGVNSVVPCDDQGHGTHTAGTAVGSDGGTNQVGMAPGAKWIGCRNMNVGAGTPATYIECFEFFLAPYPIGGTPAQGDPLKSPDVTTNSWSCPTSEGCSVSTLQAAVQAQRAAGIMLVAAAQNSGSACSTVTDPPGLYDEVYSVGALNTGTDTIASFSSRGPITQDGSNRVKPDISAPGTSTRSSTRTSATSYGSMSGTSMATPHVAGAVALLWSAQPGLNGNIGQTETILNNSTVHLTSTACSSTAGVFPNNVFGYGRLDIRSAVDQALRYAARPFDLNGDGKTDFMVFRPNGDGANHGFWYGLNNGDNSILQQAFGDSTDVPAPGDYNGDGVTDVAVFRPASGGWYISRGSAQAFDFAQWGINGDVPVPGDYDRDGKTDVAVFRPSDGGWYIRQSSNGAVASLAFGTVGDVPVPGDYDGDGKTDVAVFRPSNGAWFVLRSADNSFFSATWGTAGDKPVAGYYDADAKMDIAVWRPSIGAWFILKSTTNYTGSDAISWGTNGDVPVPGDYEADGKYDVGVFRPSTGEWFIRRSSNGTMLSAQWGQSGDKPAQTAYAP